MQRVRQKMIQRAKELFAEGKINRALGWSKGEFDYDPVVRVFHSAQELDELLYDGFCAAHLSKYLIEESKKEGGIAVFLKPCDSYNYNELLKEHRIDPNKIYPIGVDCAGKFDLRKLRALAEGAIGAKEEGDEVVVTTLYGVKRLRRDELKLERCTVCRGKSHVGVAERIVVNPDSHGADRFAEVRRLEALTADERFAFWKKELSRCIRCNACRNVCPACNCLKCVFDNPASNLAGKSNVNEFEEKLYHLIRAYHVAGRCTDCGECARVCPEGIPLQLLNRKFILDANTLYGEYQAGADAESKGPLTDYTTADAEPGSHLGRGEK